jgi:hypothetical protein
MEDFTSSKSTCREVAGWKGDTMGKGRVSIGPRDLGFNSVQVPSTPATKGHDTTSGPFSV